jgi:hypothetical protein
MAELLDRDFQRELLILAADKYPQPAPLIQGLALERRTRVNVAYLDEHGLIKAIYSSTHGRRVPPSGVLITAKGIDFLADDGGLSAILGVVTVKLHEETLKELVAAKIDASDLPPAEKAKFLTQLRELPGETTKHLVLKLVDAGLENWHKALPLLQGMLG